MTPAFISPHLISQTADWIEHRARTLGVSVTVCPSGARMNGNWLHVPVAVSPEAGDAYDQAVILQQIEEVWNDAPPFGGVNLLLVPTGHGGDVERERYEKVNELMGRQRQLLDRMDPDGMTVENVRQYQAIRQEWEETADEIERLLPHALPSVAA